MRIAVATDFSERSREAFPVARSLAEVFPGDMLLVHHAVLSTLTVPAAPAVDVVYRAAEERLADMVATDEALRGAAVRPVLLRGGNARTFGELLAENEVDLLVLASHGHTGVRRFLLGSFAEKALRFAPCPVLVHRRREHDTPQLTGFRPRRILIPHDLSPPSLRALETACDWARRFDAAVRIVHVVSFEAGATGFGPDLLGTWHQYQQRMEEVAREEISKVVSERLEDVKAETIVIAGHPVLEILAQAEEFGADLIALGSHGRSGLEHLLLGSVAEKVIRKAHCPVLAIKRTAGAP